MKDTSKANWPEGMTFKISPNRIVCSFYDSDNFLKGEVVCNLYENDKSHMKNRAMQIQHLPQMVALLKVCCFAGSYNPDAAQKMIAKPAQDILRSIGEAPNA